MTRNKGSLCRATIPFSPLTLSPSRGIVSNIRTLVIAKQDCTLAREGPHKLALLPALPGLFNGGALKREL